MQILVRYDEVMHFFELHSQFMIRKRTCASHDFGETRKSRVCTLFSRFTQRNPNSEWPEVEIKMQGENNVNCQFRATPPLLLSSTPGQVISISRPSTKRNANKLFTRRRNSGPTLSSPVIHPAHNCTYKNVII